MKTIRTQVAVIGAGAGGMGCVFRLVKNGVKTTIVDRNPDFGGSAVFSGVDGWEPGCTLDGLHSLLRRELEQIDGGCHVVAQAPNCNIFTPENGLNWDNHSFERYPWGLSVASDYTYEDTLVFEKFRYRKRFQFEPWAMSLAMNRILAEYSDNLTSLFGYRYVGVSSNDGKISSVTVTNGEEDVEIIADYFVDASGDIVLARDAGCAFTSGSESKYEFDEPSAPEKRSESVNGASYVFRIGKSENHENIDTLPTQYANFDLGEWEAGNMRRVVSCFVEYPNGDINVNMLPTMQGREYLALGEMADEVGRARVWKYWHYLQTERGMKGYTLKHIFDAGIRESYRLRGKYVLREQDLRRGYPDLQGLGITVAIANHTMDIHGENKMSTFLEKPYEVPIECTMTREYENLFVACRGASFTHIAASSVRLTRTLISIGEGVGEYIAKHLCLSVK